MLPLGKCLCHIAPAVAMVDDFEKKYTNKMQLLPSFRTVDRQKKQKNFKTRQGPSTHVFGKMSSDPNLNATNPGEGISYILSYQRWKTDKNSKSYEARAKPKQTCGPNMALSVKLLKRCSEQSNCEPRRSYSTVGFTIFPYIIGLVCKNPSYVGCTRYSCNILLTYVKVR